MKTGFEVSFAPYLHLEFAASYGIFLFTEVFSFPFLGLKTIIPNISAQENTMTLRTINTIKTNDITCPVPVQHCFFFFSKISQDLKRFTFLHYLNSDQ